VKRRRGEQFEQPSLVPLADMVTNTVGIMLFILIFVSLSAGGAVISRHLPRERRTNAKAVWLFCSGGHISSFDPEALRKQIEDPLGQATLENARNWARAFSAQRMETPELIVKGDATALDLDGGGVRLAKYLLIRHKPAGGDDEAALRTPGSALHKLLLEKSTADHFFFLFVEPDSIALFRAARDQIAAAGFHVGWSPLGTGEPARISLSGSGREATIQ
jgi:hypothetical protein